MWLTALVGLAAPAMAMEPTRRYALLVGANDGGQGRTILKYAHQDARAVRDVLTSLGGVESSDQTLLLDPSVDDLTDTLDALADEIGEQMGRAEVVFYYSGHSDETGLLIGEGHLLYPELRTQLEALPAKVRLAILDSCASGAMIRTKGGKRIAPFLVDESSQVGGFAYITSSAATEVAQEGDRIGGSFFTHYLTTGLRGAADLSGDGRVDLNEAYSFAYEATLAHTEKTQHGPQHAMKDMNLSGKGDLVLTDLQLTGSSLVLDEVLDGNAMVRRVDGSLIAELSKVSGRPVELGLAEGEYTVTLTRNRGDLFATAEVELGPGASVLVGADDLVWWEGEPTVARGNLPGEPPQAELIGAREAPKPFRIHVGYEKHPPMATDRFVFGPFVAASTSVKGLSLAGGASVVTGSAHGVQTSLVMNAARELSGLQAGLAWNQVGSGTGAQASMVANVASESFVGLQAALGVNVSRGQMRGMQTSSGVSVAEDIEGLQLSIINIGGHVGGAQIGVINIAGKVDGAQIGVVNIANDVRGAPLGILSVEGKGRHDVLVYGSLTDNGNVEVRLGGKSVYTVLGVGGTSGKHLHADFGWGGHILMGKRLWTDVDALYSTYMTSFDGSRAGLARLRATLGWQVAPQLAPFVGASANVAITYSEDSPIIIPGWAQPHDLQSSQTILYPGAFFGIQI